MLKGKIFGYLLIRTLSSYSCLRVTAWIMDTVHATDFMKLFVLKKAAD